MGLNWFVFDFSYQNLTEMVWFFKPDSRENKDPLADTCLYVWVYIDDVHECCPT